MPSGSRSLFLRILVVILAALLGAVLTERAAESLYRRYTAKAVLQIRPSTGAQLPAVFKIQAAAHEQTPTLEEITGKKTLEPVLRALHQEPSEAALLSLQRSLSVRGIRHTELVEIGVTGTNPKIAADVANAIAEEYQRQTIVEQQAVFDQAMAKLQTEVEERRQKAETLRQACSEIRSKEGITDLHPDEMGDEGKPLAEAIAELRAQVAGERAFYEKIAALSDTQILEEIAKDSPLGKSLDPTLSSLTTELKNLTLGEEKQAASGDGPEDLKLSTIRARKADLEKQLLKLVPVLRGRLETHLSANEAKLEMAEDLDSRRQPSTDAVARYREAKRVYLQELKSFEELRRKFALALMGRAMPRNPVAIWEKAAPPAQPDRPPAFVLVLGLLLGLAVGIGLASLPRPGLTAGVLLILTVLATLRWWHAVITTATNSLYQAGFL